MTTLVSNFKFGTPSSNNTVSLDGFSTGNEGITSIVVPLTDKDDGTGNIITSISENAFASKLLTNVDLSSTRITTIITNAFVYNFNLTNLTLSPYLTTIGSQAFAAAIRLQSVIFPSTLTTIGSGSFSSTGKLELVDIFSVIGPITFEGSTFSNAGSALTGGKKLTVRRRATTGSDNQTIYDGNFPSSAVFVNYCFLEGTLILTPSGYKPVESLKQGDLVRTMKGDKPIDSLITQHMYHDASEERNSKQLFSLNYPSVFQPLIVTGGHSTLVTPTPKEFEAITSIFKVPEPVDGFYRLPAYVDEKASIYEVSGDYKVYHIVIGSTFEGIFANGLLVESCVVC